jgi:hypothetical protein
MFQQKREGFMSPRKIFILLLPFLFLCMITLLLWQNRFGVPEEFEKEEDHLKYGSIGSDNLNRGIPYWIWRILPDMFPDYLPPGGKGGYDAFGLIVESGKDRPIGFSKRTFYKFYNVVDLNCAFCHVSTIRVAKDRSPEIVLGMPGNTADVEKFFLFLFETAKSPAFTVRNVMKYIQKANPEMGFFEQLAYRLVVYIYRREILDLERQFGFLNLSPPFGPGRVDTWSPYKRVILDPQLPYSVAGIVDYPSIWNQKPRENLKSHWDGSVDVLSERNIISALGAVGQDYEFLDLSRLTRITDWLRNLQPPKFDEMAPDKYRIKPEIANEGKKIYQSHCARCHDPDGSRYNQVEHINDIRTDRRRLDAFTEELAVRLNMLEGKSSDGKSWKLRHFKTTDGYANTLLDGIWLRAPYLHNGSVPTLKDLLTKPKDRPKEFYRGYDVYDWDNVGFRSDVPKEDLCDPLVPKEHSREPCVPGERIREFFKYEVSKEGNSNVGHTYGIDLSDDAKKALIEFLKTL